MKYNLYVLGFCVHLCACVCVCVCVCRNNVYLKMTRIILWQGERGREGGELERGSLDAITWQLAGFRYDHITATSWISKASAAHTFLHLHKINTTTSVLIIIDVPIGRWWEISGRHFWQYGWVVGVSVCVCVCKGPRCCTIFSNPSCDNFNDNFSIFTSNTLFYDIYTFYIVLCISDNLAICLAFRVQCVYMTGKLLCWQQFGTVSDR